MNNFGWHEFLRQTLVEANASKLLRSRHCHWDGDYPQVIVRRGRSLINFGSNDYLGMRSDLKLAQAAMAASQWIGAGSGSSPLVSGYNLSLAGLEQRIAQWQGTESALVFSSGYAMNVGVIAALVGPNDLVLSDRLNHASLIDGCRLSGAHKRVYPHADASAVEKLLQVERVKYQRALVVTESVFSMDGDIAPLTELESVCVRYDAALIVDEAHACGVFGACGAGMGEQLGATPRWLAKLGTLSKAIGACGGFVAGSRDLIEFLVNCCRSYIYSTAIAPCVVAAASESVKQMPKLADRRQRLASSGQRVRSQLQQQGWDIGHGASSIIPVVVGSSHSVLQLSDALFEAGCFVPAIRPPTVPINTARLRISLSSQHTDEQIARLIEAMGAAYHSAKP